MVNIDGIAGRDITLTPVFNFKVVGGNRYSDTELMHPKGFHGGYEFLVYWMDHGEADGRYCVVITPEGKAFDYEPRSLDHSSVAAAIESGQFEIWNSPVHNEPFANPTAKQPSLEFYDGRCTAAHVPAFDSASINTFFSNLAAHYADKAPTEIESHARSYEDAVRHWKAPRDAKFGWAFTIARILLQLDQYASLASAAKEDMAGAA
jgi:hypothetical protein